MPRPATLDAAQRLAVLRRFRRSVDGAAAVEFALVALPFLAVVGAILQIAFQIWAGQNFDRALQNGIRDIYTGQFQQDTNGQSNTTTLLTNLKVKICGPTTATIANVFNCQALKLDATTSTSFAAAAASTAFDSTKGTWSTDFGSKYSCAQQGTIVIVTAAVPFPTFFNLLGLTTKRFTSGSENGSGLLVSTAMFRTEPYQIPGIKAC